MSENRTPWSINQQQRWNISLKLMSTTDLHIGDGEEAHYPEGKDFKNKDFSYNTVIKGKNNQPYIPASTIKGNFRQWLCEHAPNHQNLIDTLFGTRTQLHSNTGQGGKAEFHDAHLSRRFEDIPTNQQEQLSNLPYWDTQTQTYIQASTAINRITSIALEQSLHHTQLVPAGIEFSLRISGLMSDEEAALLIAVCQRFSTPESAPSLGAEDASGYGRMELSDNIQVTKMGQAEIINWLKDNAPTMASQSGTSLDKDAIKTLTNAIHITAENPQHQVPLDIQFAGPFLTNAPIPAKKGKIDHIPLKDQAGNTAFPAKSFRGALRAQAERIIRTLGGECCDTETPCKPVHKKADIEKLCLACQIFGATGWKSLLHIRDFRITNNPIDTTQEMVAIDRFHGGGKETAKFNCRYTERPSFTSAITFDPHINDYAWGKGLLALALRDLKEGDITFGFGANKGYGIVESIKNLSLNALIKDEQTDLLSAFRQQCKARPQDYSFSIRKTPQQETTRETQAINTPQGTFYNPYHFIPMTEIQKETWMDANDLATGQHQDSHAIYRANDKDGNPLFHGRIICSLESKTPFFIGAGDSPQGGETTHKEHYKLHGETAIPATSLRGLISSTVEAASNSSMRVLDNAIMSYRKPVEAPLKELGIIVEKEKQLYLLKTRNLNTRHPRPISLKLSKGNNPALKEFIHNNNTWSPINDKIYYLHTEDIEEKKEYGETKSFTTSPPYRNGATPAVAGIIRIMGTSERQGEMPSGRTNEYFIPIPDQTTSFAAYIQNIDKSHLFKIDKEAIDRFHELADERTRSQKNKRDNHEIPDNLHLPFEPKGTARNTNPDEPNLRLKHGDIVYYRADNKNNTVTEIAFSAIWRKQVGIDNSVQRVGDFFDTEHLAFHQKRKHISPAELLFGFIDGDKKNKGDKTPAPGYKGKVSISTAQLAPAFRNTDVHAPSVTLKILASPKLPSPAMYFKAKNKKNGKTYFSKHELNTQQASPQGRKVYLHALHNEQQVQNLDKKGKSNNGNDGIPPWETRNPQEHKKQKVRINPVKQGTRFHFHIDFNNLSKWELDLLCYALNPDEHFEHKIGMGKPIGLGSIKITPQAIQLIDRRNRYQTQNVEQDPRYNLGQWINKQATDWQQDPRYSEKTHIESTLESAQQRSQRYQTTMNLDIHKALTLLGNPANIKHPVHYPQTDTGEIESETFKWFVANDKNAHDTLTPLNRNTLELPSLKRHREHRS